MHLLQLIGHMSSQSNIDPCIDREDISVHLSARDRAATKTYTDDSESSQLDSRKGARQEMNNLLSDDRSTGGMHAANDVDPAVASCESSCTW